MRNFYKKKLPALKLHIFTIILVIMAYILTSLPIHSSYTVDSHYISLLVVGKF